MSAREVDDAVVGVVGRSSGARPLDRDDPEATWPGPPRRRWVGSASGRPGCRGTTSTGSPSGWPNSAQPDTRSLVTAVRARPSEASVGRPATPRGSPVPALRPRAVPPSSIRCPADSATCHLRIRLHPSGREPSAPTSPDRPPPPPRPRRSRRGPRRWPHDRCAPRPRGSTPGERPGDGRLQAGPGRRPVRRAARCAAAVAAMSTPWGVPNSCLERHGRQLVALGQEVEDAAAVVVDDHHHQSTGPVEPAPMSAVAVVEERHVAGQQDRGCPAERHARPPSR